MRSPLRTTQVHSSAAIVMPLVGVALVLAVAAAAIAVVPGFQVMFNAFGGELPMSTRLLLATYRGWALATVPVAVVWLAVPEARGRGVAALLAGAVIAVALAGFCAWACYAPIFALAAVV